MTTDNRLISLYLLFSFMFLNRFRIGGVPRGTTKEKFMDCNKEKFMNPRESTESKSQ